MLFRSSRFYDEMPEHALKWVSPRGAPSNWSSDPFNSMRTDRGSQLDQSQTQTAPQGLSASAPSRSTTAHSWLRTGMQVFHNKFGEGTVLGLEGSGDDARAQINFPRHGTKWLALSVAKLTPV